MPEIKTAEQYVVARCEMLEMELDNTKDAHLRELMHIESELAKIKAELCDAYDLLNRFREFMHIRKSPSFGDVIYFDDIYVHEYPDVIKELCEYFDLSTEEDDENA